MSGKEIVCQGHSTLALTLSSGVVALGLGPFGSAAAGSLGAYNTLSSALFLRTILGEEAAITFAFPSFCVAHAVDALDVALMLRTILTQPTRLTRTRTFL